MRIILALSTTHQANSLEEWAIKVKWNNNHKDHQDPADLAITAKTLPMDLAIFITLLLREMGEWEALVEWEEA